MRSSQFAYGSAATSAGPGVFAGGVRSSGRTPGGISRPLSDELINAPCRFQAEYVLTRSLAQELVHAHVAHWQRWDTALAIMHTTANCARRYVRTAARGLQRGSHGELRTVFKAPGGLLTARKGSLLGHQAVDRSVGA